MSKDMAITNKLTQDKIVYTREQALLFQFSPLAQGCPAQVTQFNAYLNAQTAAAGNAPAFPQKAKSR